VEVAEADVTSKCYSIQFGHFIKKIFFLAGAEMKILYALYYSTKRNFNNYHKNMALFNYILT